MRSDQRAMGQAGLRHEPAGENGHLLRLLALIAVVLGLVVLTAAACLLSYSSVHIFALQAGIMDSLARLYPGSCDAMLVISGCSVLALRGAGVPSRIYAWLCFVLLLVVVAASGVVHEAKLQLPDRSSEIIAAVFPWALVLMAFGLLLALLRHARRRRLNHKPPTPAEAALVEAAPVEVAPVEAAPVEVAPVEAAPVEVAPVAATRVEVAPPAGVAPAAVAPPAGVAPAEAASPRVAPAPVAPALATPTPSDTATVPGSAAFAGAAPADTVPADGDAEAGPEARAGAEVEAGAEAGADAGAEPAGTTPAAGGLGPAMTSSAETSPADTGPAKVAAPERMLPRPGDASPTVPFPRPEVDMGHRTPTSDPPAPQEAPMPPLPRRNPVRPAEMQLRARNPRQQAPPTAPLPSSGGSGGQTDPPDHADPDDPGDSGSEPDTRPLASYTSETTPRSDLNPAPTDDTPPELDRPRSSPTPPGG